MLKSYIMKKYKIYIKRISLIVIPIFGFIACNDWLSIAPENDLIKEKFWSKTEDVDAALASTYDAFRNVALESFIWGELRADIIKFGSDVSVADYVKIAGSNISESNGKIDWSGYYKTINLANTLMYYSNDVLKKDESFTQLMKDQTDGEALFLRALSYFYLVRLWKEVPLVTEPSVSDTGNLFLPKSPEHEVIKQIIEDLNVAKEKIGPLKFQDRPEYLKGRANKYSIMALLADVYLWNEQYQKCIDYCDSINNSGLFSLESSQTWFDLYNPGNSMVESIFEIQFDDKFDNQENPLYYSIMPISGLVKFNMNDAIIKVLFNNEDLRLCGNNTPIWKYQGLSYNSNVKRNATQRDANFIYYRYSDILLMKAEALTELGRVAEANENLKKTVERAGMTFIDYENKNELSEAILNERAREFVLEGKRWFDMLRIAKRNKFSNKQLIINMILSSADVKQQAILRTRVYDTMSYYLPIPERELLYDQNLKQNPFYDR
jgi:starch-binding outer membrane protein, SusD/RagB family